PPTWARLAKATGDARYLDFLDAEYKVTYDDLFDPKENLFYRDARFIGQKTPNGKKVFWSRGNGWVFAGLPMLLQAYPEDRERRKFYVELFQKMAPAVLAAQQPDGLWRPSLQDPEQIAIGETSGSAFYIYGLAWGVNHGLLDRDKYWPAVERGWNAILTRIQPDGLVGFVQRIGDAPDHLTPESTQLYGTGAVLMAGSEILRSFRSAMPKPVDLLAEAEKLVAADKTPRAYARLVPERSDDLAWENDKVIHRIYGPALREGDEASGIDVWVKNVARPILSQWYADDIAGRQSYHENHGEGYDGYKVGDSTGVGGTGIWHDGRFVHADVYDKAKIFFTKPDVAEFEASYTYPPIDGKTYYETRTVMLRMGERLNEITARFTLDAEGKKPAANLEVAIGLVAQTAKREIELSPDAGIVAIWDVLEPGDSPFGIGALVAPGAKMLTQPHTSTDPKADTAFAILHTDANGEVKYRIGSAWTGDGEIKSKDAWLDYLKKAAKK
ncbi:MAG: glycoside hydrolase family 88 protein, partial [Chthoniobacterales bacterium]